MSDSADKTVKTGEQCGTQKRIDGAAAPFLALVLVGFAIHLLVHQLNIVSIAGMPFGFYLAAQGSPILLAVMLFWIAARRERILRHKAHINPIGSVRGGALSFPISGLAGAGAIGSGGTIAGIAGAMFLQGYDGLAYGLGLMIGLVVAALFVIPSRAETLTGSITGLFSQRYESAFLSACSATCVGACLVLLLGAEISIVSTILVRWLSVSNFDADLLAAISTTVFSVIVLALRKLLSLSLALGLVAITVALIGLTAASSLSHFGLPVPQLSYGYALQEISGLERALVVDQLADPDSLNAHVRPRTSFDAVNFFAIAACFAFGIAAMPLLAVFRGFERAPDWETPGVANHPYENAAKMSLSLAWAGLFVCVLVVTLPSVAAFEKVDLLSSIRDGRLLSTLPTWTAPYAAGDLLTICGQTDLSFANLKAACGEQASQLSLNHIALQADATALAMPELANQPIKVAMAFAVILAVVGIVAGACLVSSMVIEAADVRPREVSSESTPILAGYLTSLVVPMVMVVIGTGLVMILRPGALALVSWAFSLGASAIFAALVIGHYWRRVSAIAVVMSMIFGFAVCAFYIVATTYFAPWFASAFQAISSAPSWQIDEIAKFEAACRAGSGAACEQLNVTAREAANWFGVSNHASGVFGLPVSIGVLAFFTLLVPRAKT